MHGKWHDPAVELVSIYCDQKTEDGTHGEDPNDPDGNFKGDLTWRREVLIFCILSSNSPLFVRVFCKSKCVKLINRKSSTG